jgi:ribosome maturation factor RimP
MTDTDKVTSLVNSRIEGTGIFLVDSREGVSIEECADLSRWLSAELDQDDENFSLEVSSPGLDAPLRLRPQYEKNIGREVEMVMKSGKKMKGTLREVKEDEIVVEVTEKQLAGGSQKKKKSVKVNRTFAFEDIKSTKVVITF